MSKRNKKTKNKKSEIDAIDDVYENEKTRKIEKKSKKRDKKEISAKKAARCQKREERRRKKALRRNDDAELYSPEKMRGFALSIPIGYFLRFFSIGLSVFGVCALIVDSFEFAEINLWWLLLFCVGAVSAFSLCFIGVKTLIAGVGLIAAFVGGAWLFVGSPATLALSGVETLWNRAMEMLEELGYATFGDLSLPSLGALSVSADAYERALIYGGIFTVAALLSLIFAAFSAKRTRILPMLIFGGAICAICFTYNLTGSNIGIVCILAGLCSTLVLSGYDKLYAEHKKSKKSRAYSGFASSLAGLLVIAVLAGPAAAMKEPWREIKSTSRPISSARNIVMTLLTGGDPRLNVMNSLIDKRSVDLEDIEFNGTQLFSVSAYTQNQNIYLRSWIGSDFDFDGNSWNVLSDDDYKEMLETMRSRYSGISGDTITYSLYSRLNPWLDADSFPKNGYYGESKLGYYATLVDVRSIKSTGLLYTMPQSYAGSVIGNYISGSRENGYDQSVNLYSDGIYTSSWLNLKKEFTAPAIVPTYIDRSYAETAAKQAKYNLVINDFLNNVSNVSIASADELRTKFAERLEREGLSDFGTDGLEEFFASSNRRQWIAENVTAYEQYEAYVKSFYTTTSDSQGAKTVASELLDEVNAASTDFDKIMAVVNYMVLNYEYTYTPTKPSGEYSSDLDAFLLETKNGYCVQFATAATLIFRELGIPARYVQGYVANDFYSSTDDDGDKIYRSKVTDEDAHAWVEVWIDGLGWRMVEVTPGYYSDIYYVDRNSDSNIPSIVETATKKPDSTTEPITSEPSVTTDDKKGDDDEDESFSFDTDDLVRVCIIAASIGLVCGAVLLLVRRQKKIRAGREYYIERAVYGSFDDTDEMTDISRVLVDGIWQIISCTVGKPNVGQSPIEFAYTIDHPSRPQKDDKKGAAAVRRRLSWSHTMTEITMIIEKLEFSGNIDRDELEMLGEFIDSLIKTEYTALSPIKKLWYHYIRAII